MLVSMKKFLSTLFILTTTVYVCVLLWSYRNHPRNILFNWFEIRSESVSNGFLNNSFWVTEFREHECRIYSQNGEDGVLLWLFANIGTLNRPPCFVEFGVENGDQCNTRFLRQHLGWQGLMMDGSHENFLINLHREKISAANINDLLVKHRTPSVIDLLSIDVDFDDYFIWKSILQAGRFQARVVVVEFNFEIPANENRVINPYQDSRRWTGTTHYGAGILAMAALGRAHGYTLVYGEKNGVNLFFVQSSILKNLGVLHKVPSLEKLHVSNPGWRHKAETDKTRSWIWNDTIWRDD